MKTLLTSAAVALTLSLGLAGPSMGQDNSYITAPNELSAEDTLAVQGVVARLNHALDAADYPLYGSFFAEDGVFESDFGDAVGPDAVAAALTQVAPFITNKRHIAGNYVVSGSGDDAVVTTYLVVFERETGLEFVGSAVNTDTLRRIDGEWLVTRHASTLDPATQRMMMQMMQQ